MRDFARGRPSGYDRPVEAFARRLVAAARAGEADEILIVGHSAGGLTAPIVTTRALDLDPDLGRHGPRVTLVTVGSLLLVGAGAFASSTALQRTQPGAAADGSQPDERGRFMAILGLVLCAFFALVILAMAVPRVVLDACQQ